MVSFCHVTENSIRILARKVKEKIEQFEGLSSKAERLGEHPRSHRSHTYPKDLGYVDLQLGTLKKHLIGICEPQASGNLSPQGGIIIAQRGAATRRNAGFGIKNNRNPDQRGGVAGKRS